MFDEIIVVAYDPGWPAQFRALAEPLRAALGQHAIRIDHIGSTAVPQLAAKPVIDIQISVAALEPVDRYRAPIESCGFCWRPQNPERTKRYFREASGPRVHIHVRRFGSWSEQFALLFRDYLRAHAHEAEQYAALKFQLARQFRADREAYTNATDPLIWQIIRRANDWSQATGWEPEPSDA